MKGFSHATITIEESSVLKTGDNVFEQGKLCESYPLNLVCPKVLEKFDNSYRMERLDELTAHDREFAFRTMKYVRQLLARHVWSIPDTVGPEYRNWRYRLSQKFHDVTGLDIEPLVDSLWIDQSQWQTIHGDPTMSNTMRRGNVGELVLIDPLRSPYIPPHWTVDMGKLLQSCIGWENIIDAWQYDGGLAAHRLTAGMDDLTLRRSWFWCMIHCMRIIPYADGPDRGPQRLWAVNAVHKLYASFCSKVFSTEAICTTLSI